MAQARKISSQMIQCNQLVNLVRIKLKEIQQIGNVTVEQIATTLGSNPDHVVEALEDVLALQTMEEQDTTTTRVTND